MGYNISNVKDKDRKRVKWDIVVDGKKETLSLKGESIEFEMKEEWFEKVYYSCHILKNHPSKSK